MTTTPPQKDEIIQKLANTSANCGLIQEVVLYAESEYERGVASERAKTKKLVQSVKEYLREKNHSVPDRIMVINTFRKMEAEFDVYKASENADSKEGNNERT